MDKNLIKLLTALFENGYNTDKAILSVGIKELMEIKCFNEVNATNLLALQSAIKGNKLIPFLSGSLNEEE